MAILNRVEEKGRQHAVQDFPGVLKWLSFSVILEPHLGQVTVIILSSCMMYLISKESVKNLFYRSTPLHPGQPKITVGNVTQGVNCNGNACGERKKIRFFVNTLHLLQAEGATLSASLSLQIHYKTPYLFTKKPSTVLSPALFSYHRLEKACHPHISQTRKRLPSFGHGVTM